jgi:hypothetical protein
VEVARETLRLALDAWKNGEQPEALKDHRPSIYVADHDWGDGHQLVAYQVSAQDRPFGSHLRCQVQLSLRTHKGKVLNKKATYHVGTSRALTVVRTDDR